MTMRFAFKKTCLQTVFKKMTRGRARTTRTHRCLHLGLSCVYEVVQLTTCDQISLPPESLQLEGQRSLCMVTLTTLNLQQTFMIFSLSNREHQCCFFNCLVTFLSETHQDTLQMFTLQNIFGQTRPRSP